MSNPILEKSLDEIIDEKKPPRKFQKGPRKDNSRINKPVSIIELYTQNQNC